MSAQRRMFAAREQQTDASGVHRVADHVAEPGDVLRHADTHRHMEQLFSEIDDAFHLRTATSEHDARCDQLFAALELVRVFDDGFNEVRVYRVR